MTRQVLSLSDMTKFGYPGSNALSREPTRISREPTKIIGLNRDATKIIALNREATKYNGLGGNDRVKAIVNNR